MAFGLVRTALGAAVLLASCIAVSAQPNWVTVWESAIAVIDVPSATGHTVRQFARLSASGPALRITISNSTGTSPASFSDVRVALAGDAPGSVRSGSDRAVSFGGEGSVEVPPGASVVSDPVAMPVAPLTRIAVSAYVVTASAAQVGHLVAGEANAVALGDHVDDPVMPGAQITTSGFYLAGIAVAGPAVARGAVVTLGDSLTDGYLSTVGAERRWPDRLAERLSAQIGGGPAVSNAGLWGNGLLQGNPAGVGGISAVARLQRDVLSRADVRWLILFIGINDIMFHSAEPATARAIVADDLQIVAQAHDRGVRVYCATLTPFRGAGAGLWTPAREEMRARVNTWIRNSGAFDAVLDFDAAVRRPGLPSMVRADFDGGDHLHLNDAGYRAIGDSIPLELFR